MDLSERGGGGRHPWEVARARFFIDVLARARVVTGATRLLDVGSGDAFVCRTLLERFAGARASVWDHAYSDEELAALSRVGLEATRARPTGTFDVALLLDVLEHVEDDDAALADVLGALAPGAHVLVSVPAWPALHSSHDMYLRHHRRYTPAAARALLERGGLTIVRAGGLFHSLLLPRALSVTVETRTGRASFRGLGAWGGGAAMTSLMTAALRADNALSQAFAALGVEVPGLSWWALCRRGP